VKRQGVVARNEAYCNVVVEQVNPASFHSIYKQVINFWVGKYIFFSV
jgi:hypothetical protein